jgi:hypothetical protein
MHYTSRRNDTSIAARLEYVIKFYSIIYSFIDSFHFLYYDSIVAASKESSINSAS